MRKRKSRLPKPVQLKYEKARFTMQTAIEDIKSKYHPCSISINDLDDSEYFIISLSRNEKTRS